MAKRSSKKRTDGNPFHPESPEGRKWQRDREREDVCVSLAGLEDDTPLAAREMVLLLQTIVQQNDILITQGALRLRLLERYG